MQDLKDQNLYQLKWNAPECRDAEVVEDKVTVVTVVTEDQDSGSAITHHIDEQVSENTNALYL